MIFLDFDLGQRKRGEIVEVTLTGGANVQLMDVANLSNYKVNKKCRFYGGLATRSPYRLAVPEAGLWHVIIDTRGLGNTTVATVKTLSDSKQIFGKKYTKDD
ncbi:MAG: DUF1883 domain-containing protein [Synergistaceae bacterium]|nr:DUF1883 domain-containing protein [Synergistaceae bacterium]